jgi:hypothetical protein
MSSYNDHSWVSDDADSDVLLPLHDADLAFTADEFDVEDVVQSMANLSEYRERVLKSSTLYKFNMTL